jgi:hypothetical protein
MVYETGQHRVMLTGITASDPTDQWFYGIASPASLQTIGYACTGSRGVPILTSGMPYSGLASLLLDLSSVLPSSPCIFGLSALPDNTPVGGWLHPLPEGSDPTPAVMSNGYGFASLKLQVPSDPSLRGGGFHAQAFVVDPQGGPFPEGSLGLAFSRQLALVIGD